MKNSRRLFLAQCTALSAGAITAAPLKLSNAGVNQTGSLLAPHAPVTIYSIAGVRGCIGPLHEGAGGLRNIKTELETRAATDLVLDAGGFMSGAEDAAGQARLVRLMNHAGYTAAGLSGRELSGGEASLARLIPLMNFPLINCNHVFNSGLAGMIKPYYVVQSRGIRIGITGVCQRLSGIKYLGLLKCADETAAALRNKERCDFVICLSHLGDDGTGEGLTNSNLAAQSENIDMVIGGGGRAVHNSSFIIWNKLRREVVVSEPASHGLTIGKASVSFDAGRQKNGLDIYHILPVATLNYQSIVKIKQIKAKLVAV